MRFSEGITIIISYVVTAFLPIVHEVKIWVVKERGDFEDGDHSGIPGLGLAPRDHQLHDKDQHS